jgi:methionyl-tRNA synthetase
MWKEEQAFREIEAELYEKAYFLEAIASISQPKEEFAIQSLTDVTMHYLEKTAPWIAEKQRERDAEDVEKRLNGGPQVTISGEDIRGFEFDET